MSAETEAALRDAIIAHAIATNPDAGRDLLAEWVVQSAWVLADHAHVTRYGRAVPDGQPFHHTLGLAVNLVNDLTDYGRDDD